MPARGNKRHYFPGTVLGNRFYIGDKPFGMEPGSLVVKIDEALIKNMIKAGIIKRTEEEFEKLLLGKEGVKREQEMIKFLSEEMEKLHQQLDQSSLQLQVPEKEYLTQTISTQAKRMSIELKRLFGFTQQLQEKGLTGEVPQTLIKQDYMDTSVAPPTDRLRKTTRGKSLSSIGLYIWKRGKEWFSSRKKENSNALSEAFANGVARAYAMPAQNQFVILGKYENGDLKIMTDCEWQPGLVGMTGQVEGKKYQGNYVDEQSKRPDGKFDSAIHRLDCAGQNLALMLIQGDDDGFGSKLQNKMILGKELFGIDFGHAYRGTTNPLIDNLSVDFTLDDKTLSKYKNFSILLDSPPTDQMLGVLYTYKAMDEVSKRRIFGDAGIVAVDKVIEAYKNYYQNTYPQFAEKIDKIKPGCVEMLRDDYVKHLQVKMHEMLSEAKKLKVRAAEVSNPEKSHLLKEAAKVMQCASELRDNIERVEKTAAMHQAQSEKLLEKFKQRLKLTPDLLLVVNNLSKLTSNTRATDKDSVVVLNHLQIEHDKNRVEWNVTSNAGGILTIRANTNKKQSMELTAVLLNFLQDHGQNISGLRIDNQEGISIKIPQEKLPQLLQACSEENIRAFKGIEVQHGLNEKSSAKKTHFRMFDRASVDDKHKEHVSTPTLKK